MQKVNLDLAIKPNVKMFNLASWVKENSKEIDQLREYIKTGKEEILNQLQKVGAVLDFKLDHNIVVTSGRNVLARRLAGNTTYTGAINYGALGTQASPSIVNGATQLGTEVYRKLASSTTYSSNIAYIDFFYAATDCNGTYTEFGNFIDGAAGANTGQLFSYIATGSWVKSSIQSLFVSCQYTIN